MASLSYSSQQWLAMTIKNLPNICMFQCINGWSRWASRNRLVRYTWLTLLDTQVCATHSHLYMCAITCRLISDLYGLPSAPHFGCCNYYCLSRLTCLAPLWHLSPRSEMHCTCWADALGKNGWQSGGQKLDIAQHMARATCLAGSCLSQKPTWYAYASILIKLPLGASLEIKDQQAISFLTFSK